METQQLTFDFTTSQPHIVTERNDDELKLRLGEFAGPLDLLLHLIRQEQVNIWDIPVARITNEYLRYLRLMEKLDIAVAGDFLVMAAQLIEIKSKMLLPREPLTEIGEEAEIDPRQELVDRLLEHQKFKSAAQMLWTKSTVEQSIFTRGRQETDEQQPEINVSVFDLINVFQKILARQKEEISLEIEREEMTLAEMLENLEWEIVGAKKLNLTEFFSRSRTRRELILAFLATLELVRTTRIRLFQDQIFGEIIAETN
ncbi:MAG TPA: segregation/condensation protein A [Pyrinomonadaceae bacterium]|nr:segregation/condensation protein A [Pyrinomonadaceae bacterium]